MEDSKQTTPSSLFLLTLLFTLYFLSITTSSRAHTCRPASCSPSDGPVVRFPFRLGPNRPAQCGYRGFDLHCNSMNQTIFKLNHEPSGAEFVVDRIDYPTQTLLVTDPDGCLPRRILTVDFSAWPFRGAQTRNYTFLNCTGGDYVESGGLVRGYMQLKCLSGENYTVVGFAGWVGEGEVPGSCRLVRRVTVPVVWREGEGLEVVWSEPKCRECEDSGGACGFGGGSEIACYGGSKSGLSRTAKYGIILGVGIPGIVCAIALTCYICGLITSFNIRRRDDSDRPTITTTDHDQRPAIKASDGLDPLTIESYPKTVLGESRRDMICSICLSHYRHKESIRMLPECDHYFHARCIDEWLRLNRTCPLCSNFLFFTILSLALYLN